MMETLVSASGFTSEAHLPGIPRTPPYTPSRTKHKLERGASPASSNTGSIHPIETSSPEKKAAAAAERAKNDDIRVEELVEGDAGYHTDLDVVYPQEASSEEDSDDEDNGTKHDKNNIQDDNSGSESESDDNDYDYSSSSSSDSEAADLTQPMSRMCCKDKKQKDFEQQRRRRRLHKRNDPRMFKRSHSQSVESEFEANDVEGKDDHDLKSSKRRLRRRVQGPRLELSPSDIRARSLPEVEIMSSGTDSQAEENSIGLIVGDVMDYEMDAGDEK